MAGATERVHSTGDVAAHFGVREWQLVQIYRRGAVAEPQRLGGRRAIPERDFPAIERALREYGYLATTGTGAK